MDKDGQIKVSDKYSLQGRVFNRVEADKLGFLSSNDTEDRTIRHLPCDGLGQM